METNQSNPHTDSPTDEHKVELTIIVNGRPRKWNQREISFQQVVILAFGSYSDDPNIVYTVSFKHGHNQGTMVKGETIPVREGMIFNVTRTDKS